MPQVQLDEKVFDAAQRRAAETGYASVDQYIADVVSQDLREQTRDDGDDDGQTPSLDPLFTPERLAQIDRALADVRAGNCFSDEEVRQYFHQKREAWERDHRKG